MCEYAYSPALAEKLHDPKVFALINLNMQRLFLSQLSDGTRRADFEKHGWLSPLNADRIAAFWDEIAPGVLEGQGG